MPGEEAAYPEDDLYPSDGDEQRKLSSWAQNAIISAEKARQPHEDRWKRYYKHYRAWIKQRQKGDWRSKVPMPESFQAIETILPRLIAELPKFTSLPHGPEDVPPAEVMQKLLDHASTVSGHRYEGMYIELYKAFKDALIYGTGIIKDFYAELPAYKRETVPTFEVVTETVTEPLIDPDTGQPMMDADGNPVLDEREVEVEVPTGTETVKRAYTAYAGPICRAIDPFNFWVAPESMDIDSAEYAFERKFREKSEVKRLIKEGIYRLPEGMDIDDPQLFETSEEQPHTERLSSVDLGTGRDENRKKVEIHEFWIDDGDGSPGRILTLANRSVLLRVQENPFDHGQKPYSVIYDYRQSHEFWGIGEIEHIEGLQDLLNAIVNQRIDNVRLGMDQGFAVNMHQLEDPRDLQRGPGQVVRIKGDGMRPEEVIWPLPTTEVTSSAFNEAAQTQGMIERTTGVSGLQRGIETPSMLDTATGAAMMQEAGNTRFALKTRVNELGALKRLARHWGSHFQQFTTEDQVVRLVGPDGAVNWLQVTPDGIQGALDYDIQSESIMQSETMRKQQAMDLFNLTAQAVSMGGLPPQAVTVAYMDVLEAFGKKDAEGMLGQPPQQGLPPQPGQPQPRQPQPGQEQPGVGPPV